MNQPEEFSGSKSDRLRNNEFEEGEFEEKVMKQ